MPNKIPHTVFGMDIEEVKRALLIVFFYYYRRIKSEIFKWVKITINIDFYPQPNF